jgi:uncharacterized protein (UPF0333 family)
MNKKIIFLLILLFIISVAGWQIKKNFFQTTQKQTQTTSTEVKSKINYLCPPGETVLSALINSGNGLVQTKGKTTVLAINGIAQGDGKYWQYTINGNSVENSADTYKCNGGENIVWELK